MAAVQYLPASAISSVVSFCQYTSGGGTSGLQTDLNTAFGATAGQVQVFTDAQSTGNALVVSNDTTVLSVPVNNYVSFCDGKWLSLSSAQLSANYVRYYTS